MSVRRTSNYSSAMKAPSSCPAARSPSPAPPSSSSSLAASAATHRTGARAGHLAANAKFLLINLLILCQRFGPSTAGLAELQYTLAMQEHHNGTAAQPSASPSPSPSSSSSSPPLVSIFETKLPSIEKLDDVMATFAGPSADDIAATMPGHNHSHHDDVEDYEDVVGTKTLHHNDHLPSIDDIVTNLTAVQEATQEYDASTVMLLGKVTHACLQKCVDEESLFINDFGIVCARGDNRTECYRSRCFKGCELWWNALKEFEPCQEACSSPQFYPFDLPCISACEQSQRLYWQMQQRRVQAALQQLRPQLLHDNDDASASPALTLQWPLSQDLLPAQYLASRPFNIQYQYAAMVANGSLVAGADQVAAAKEAAQQEQWWNLADYNCNENFECDVMDGLMPFTAYRFRFQLPFGDDPENILYTTASEVYQTPAMGVPISAPIINQAMAIDDTHIVLFWTQGKFTNAPLKNYKIELWHEGQMLRQELLPPDTNHYIFSKLQPNTMYGLHLSMLNEEGGGPWAKMNVTTKYMEKSVLKMDDFNSLIMAGEYSIVLKSLDPLIETRTLFRSQELLSDFDVHQHNEVMFVVDVKGHIYSIPIANPSEYISLKLPSDVDGFVASKLSVDWLNQRLYISGQLPGELSLILTADFLASSWQILAENFPSSINRLMVDPLNGWLFAVTSDYELLKIDLATKELKSIETSFEVAVLANDMHNYLLKALPMDSHSLYELSYDGGHSSLLETGINPQLQGQILYFNLLDNQMLLASNGSHLLRENLLTHAVELMTIRDVEYCWKIMPLMAHGLARLQQPLPQPLRAPQNLRAILSDTKAIISWDAPGTLEEFQSPASWQKWEYELEILDVSSNSAFNIRSIKSSFFQVERLQANNLYKIKVRASFAGAPRSQAQRESSEWSEELTTRTWPMGQQRLLWSSFEGLYESNELSEQVELRSSASTAMLDFVQVNSSLFYISAGENSLKCQNLLHPEMSCSFPAFNVNSLDYDWRGGYLYWSDVFSNCLVRSDLKGEHREMLPIFGVRHLRVDALKGYLYYTSETRLVRRALSGASSFGQEMEYYHSEQNGESLRGFALDLMANHIYWLVQHQEQPCKLYRSDVDEPKAEELMELPKNEMVALHSMQYLKELDGFIWLNDKGTLAMILRKELMPQLMRIPAPQLKRINFVKLRQDYQPFPDFSIIPEAVERESIEITEGNWDDFNVKWAPINNPYNLSILYKVLITSYHEPAKGQLLSFEVQQPLVRITEFKMASHNINVTITPLSPWARGPSTSIQLRTPSAAFKQPRNLRVFVEQLQEPLQPEANLTALVRWDSPDNISSEKEVFYKVYCWQDEQLHSVKDVQDMGLRTNEAKFHNLKREQSYNFQVQAFSLSRSKGGEKSALLTYYINPEIQAPPKLIFTTSEFIGELDLDLNMTKVWVYTTSEVDHLVIMPGEQRLIWVNENVELMSYQPGSSSLKLARMRAEVLSLAVDWIQRKVYWAERSADVFDHAVDIYELDLNQYEGKVMMGAKIFSLDEGRLLKDLIVLPFSRLLLWLEYESDAHNATLHGRNLTDHKELRFKNLPLLLKMFEGSWHPEMETVNLMDAKGKLYAYELQRQLMTSMKIPLAMGEHIRNFERDAGYIYQLNNHSIKAYNRRKHILEYNLRLQEVRLIKSFNFQQYPAKECLMQEQKTQIDEEKMKEIFLKKRGETFITLFLSPTNPFANCRLPMPGLKYDVFIKSEDSDEQHFTPPQAILNITNLQPFTNYSLTIQSHSYYQSKLLLPPLDYPEFFIHTLEGNPSQPLNFTVSPLSPTELEVTWSEPEFRNAQDLYYQINWQLGNSSLSSRKVVEGFKVTLLNLEPDQDYTVWLEVYSQPSKHNETEKITVTTFPKPEDLQLLQQQPYNLTLQWQPRWLYDSVILECLPHDRDPEVASFSMDITGAAGNITVVNLEPKTKYEFYLRLLYPAVERPYVWPELPTEHYMFETLGDAPGHPGQPQIEHITDEIFKVFWQPAEDHGSDIVEYSLEALQARHHKRIRRGADEGNHTASISLQSQLPWAEEPQPLEDKWVIYCNTSELSCIVRDLHTMRLLKFRVRARNVPYGWGPYSEDSERVLEPFVSPQKRNSLVLAIIAPAAIVTTCVILLVIVRKVHKRRLKAKQLLAKSRPSIWSNASTMQQQLAARNRAFSINSSSTMYTGGPLSDADIALLPHISWNQITLLNFLGSGAFGEVYEGLIRYEEEGEQEKVAIKSLRKGASEFAELLQEAQLMSNFKHENIVRLIGVCCNSESISIIMEHMEGGDLLSYLRESRPNSTRPVAALQLLDLMGMCIDVATGMAYLEDMHFVHRDLACRNCLVSSRVPSRRSVKIGDFGLARDIYKNDYYRKEGEALMPVRWMAPESLIDGVFTTQSDVWAFGVLCWEILTLGQQPYAVRNNFEVLNYVKDEGRLEQPDNCPDKMFALMSDCWQTDAEERPSFRKILNTLLAIKTDVRRVSLGDYALYANQYGAVLSSFYAGTLKKVEESEEPSNGAEKADPIYDTKNNLEKQEQEENKTLDKNELRVRFNGEVNAKSTDTDSGSDESQLIDTKVYRVQENPDYYINEGVSRL